MGVRTQAVSARARKGVLAIAILTEHAVEVPTVPFRGIDPFRYLDHPIFFAREEETHRLTSLVSVYRGVMLYGDSGSGKSSLINAGLIPEAIRQGFQPERLRVQPRGSRRARDRADRRDRPRHRATTVDSHARGRGGVVPERAVDRRVRAARRVRRVSVTGCC